MRFNELIYGEAADVADALHGDNAPETIPELRAALTNALRRIAQLEKALGRLGGAQSASLAEPEGEPSKTATDDARKVLG